MAGLINLTQAKYLTLKCQKRPHMIFAITTKQFVVGDVKVWYLIYFGVHSNTRGKAYKAHVFLLNCNI